MTKNEALRKAIKALEEAQDIIEGKVGQGGYFHKPIQACKDALAETQEPVALSKLLHQVIHGDFNGDNTDDLRLALNARNELLALIHPPPSRELVGLSDVEIKGLDSGNQGITLIARAIEAKLKKKNG